ncbi:MAG: Hpt domain-containing protein, partial [Pseudomonadota bacterium]|nr:Hpt domain-containing protein [Pseudomonadota bacterium]
MNEFIEQFLLEARDYVEQAMRALHTLEHAPRDAQAFDELFRAFHTLKGSAGIVEFSAMERLLHAGEDALGEVRKAGLAVSPELNVACVACLDQTLRWLDAMEHTGLPPADADAQTDRVLRNVATVFTSHVDAEPQAIAARERMQSDPELPALAQELL